MDINALRDRISNLNRRTNKFNDIWKPTAEHVVRLLPYPHADEPFIELYFHYELGESSVLCPKANFGNDCEVCDFASLLKAWKDQGGHDKREADRKQDFEVFKKIQAKARIFVAMVERGKELDGPKFWGITPNQAVDLLKVCTDTDRLTELGIDISNSADVAKRSIEVLTNPEKGYDVNVSFAKAGEKGNLTSYAQTTISAKIKPSLLSKDKKSMNDILSVVKKMSDVYPEVSSAEISKLLKKFIGAGAQPAKAEGGTEKYQAAKVVTKAVAKDAPVKGGRTIDEAFGDMLEDD